MNSKLSFLFLALSISLAALFSGTDPSYSCGPGFDYEKYRISYVDPDLLSDSIYHSFYRTILRDHQSGDSYGDSPTEEFRGGGWPAIRDAENVRDWKRYFGQSISERSIEDLIYSMGPEMIEDVLAILSEGQKPNVRDIIRPPEYEWEEPDTLYISEALQQIVNREDVPFLRYLLYANECEPYAWADDPWTEESEQNDTAAMLALIEKGLQQHNECRSDYLKLRYAYQIVRMARYSGQYERAVELYDRLVATNPTRSSIRFRALSHKAGAARLAGNMALSNYSFAQVFDSSEGEREIAVRGFRLRSQADWDALYRLARNNHERATMHMLRGFKNEGLTFDYMREMYKLEPASPQLAMALLRELHRVESYLYDNMETRNWGAKERKGFIDRIYEDDTTREVLTNLDPAWSNASYVSGGIGFDRRIGPGRTWDTLVFVRTHDDSYERDTMEVLSGREYILAFRRFVMELAQERKVLEPALWYMVAGYIDMMDEDFDLANECLEEAERVATGNEDLRQQIVLLDFMRRVKSNGEIDRELEEKIYPTLKWFESKQIRNHHSKFDKVMAAIGQQYLRQDDVPRAIFAFARAGDYITLHTLLDIYSTDSDIEKLQGLIARGGSTEYERMLLGSAVIPNEGLLDLRATKFLRKGKFKEANELLQQIPESYWHDREEYGDDGYYYNPYDTIFQPMRMQPNSEWFYSSTDTTFLSGHNLISGSWPMSGEDAVEAEELGARKFNKRTFAQTAVQLIDQAKSSGRADSAYYRLANLLFNNWRWRSSDLSGGWDGLLNEYEERGANYPFNISGVAKRLIKASREFDEEFATRKLARVYYERVFKMTKDRELQARCAYMLDICSKRPQTNTVHHPDANEQDRTGYTMLIGKYRDTRFSQWVLSQCSTYRYFEKKRLGGG